jgi:hypothetical protein
MHIHSSAAHEWIHEICVRGIAEYFGPRCPMMRLVDHPSMLRDAHGPAPMPG